MNNKTTIIYTDGGCEPNPGQGGWAAIIIENQNGTIKEKEISGYLPETTNNRAEITAMLEGLKSLKHPNNVTIYTDSQYLKRGIGNWKEGKPTKPTGWCVRWKKQGWKRKDGPLANTDLWQKLWKACEKQKNVNVHWIKGHNNNHYNDRCDTLAMEMYLNNGAKTK